jgi:hypothetical protein
MLLTKRHFFADYLSQCVPPAYLVTDEVLGGSNFLADGVEKA